VEGREEREEFSVKYLGNFGKKVERERGILVKHLRNF